MRLDLCSSTADLSRGRIVNGLAAWDPRSRLAAAWAATERMTSARIMGEWTNEVLITEIPSDSPLRMTFSGALQAPDRQHVVVEPGETGFFVEMLTIGDALSVRRTNDTAWEAFGSNQQLRNGMVPWPLPFGIFFWPVGRDEILTLLREPAIFDEGQRLRLEADLDMVMSRSIGEGRGAYGSAPVQNPFVNPSAMTGHVSLVINRQTSRVEAVDTAYVCPVSNAAHPNLVGRWVTSLQLRLRDFDDPTIAIEPPVLSRD